MERQMERRRHPNQPVDWRADCAKIDPQMAKRPPSVSVATTLLARGFRASGEQVYREMMDRSPSDQRVFRMAALVLRQSGKKQEATDCFRRYVELNLAELGASEEQLTTLADFHVDIWLGKTDNTIPTAYVRTLFDQLAERWDQTAREQRYSVPQLMKEAVERVAQFELSKLTVLDLGCGTGLMAAAINDWSSATDGVDLSPNMIQQAQATGLYRQLTAGALTAGQPLHAPYDLITAADVLPYIGDLQPTLAAARAALRPEGLFAISLELHLDDSFALHTDGRFRHGREYLTTVAKDCGFEVIYQEQEIGRLDQQRPTEYLIAVLKRSE